MLNEKIELVFIVLMKTIEHCVIGDAIHVD
jgi:hypothetical protein